MVRKFKDIFVDFDDTLVDSLEAFCKVYNCRYSEKVDWKTIKRWDFVDKCPKLKTGEVLDIFASKEFFKNLRLKHFAKETLKNLSDKNYPITIVTIGTLDNCSRKAQYIKNNLSFIDKTILISPNEKDSLPMNKSFIDMKHGIFVDDVEANLNSSNAKLKILFETMPNVDWNKEWRGEKIKDWKEFNKYFE